MRHAKVRSQASKKTGKEAGRQEPAGSKQKQEGRDAKVGTQAEAGKSMSLVK